MKCICYENRQFNHKLSFLSPARILGPTVSPHNLTKPEIMGTSKISISLIFSELGKIQKDNELGKKCFPLRKKSFKPIGNSAHTAEFLTLRKFDLLMLYPSRQLAK